MQRCGFDEQMTGFGLMSTYPADNEYCVFSDMRSGFEITSRSSDKSSWTSSPDDETAVRARALAAPRREPAFSVCAREAARLGAVCVAGNA
jgi:hypothetical protein